VELTEDQSYYAVIFTSIQSKNTSGYAEMASKMEALAQKQPGYLGMEHARSELGLPYPIGKPKPPSPVGKIK